MKIYLDIYGLLCNFAPNIQRILDYFLKSCINVLIMHKYYSKMINK